jgi:hypothetical protein
MDLSSGNTSRDNPGIIHENAMPSRRSSPPRKIATCASPRRVTCLHLSARVSRSGVHSVRYPRPLATLDAIAHRMDNQGPRITRLQGSGPPPDSCQMLGACHLNAPLFFAATLLLDEQLDDDMGIGPAETLTTPFTVTDFDWSNIASGRCASAGLPVSIAAMT